MENAVEWLRGLLAHFCHQLPERTLTIDRVAALMCHRCSAFYATFLVAAAALIWTRPHQPRPLSSLAVGVPLVVLMALDATSWPSSNLQRHLTGAGAGAGLALIALPLVARRLKLHCAPSTRAPWLAWLAALATILIIYAVPSTLTVYTMSLLALLGLVALGYTLNILVVALTFRRLSPLWAAMTLILAEVTIVWWL